MQIAYIRFVLEEIFDRNSNYQYKYLSKIKCFKNIESYTYEVAEQLKNNFKKRWIGGIYKYIYEHQLDFNDYKKYKELSNEDNGVYIIANDKDEVLYIGKANNKDFDVFARVFDHLVPRKSQEFPNGQVNNNTPEIWDEMSKGNNLKILVCCNINFDPELLEVYLISRYKMKYGKYPLYNRETAKPFAKKSSIADYTEFVMKI